jgi:hypothetical protein
VSIYKTKRVGKKRVSLHRWMMEKHIGRPLLPNEYVHHINHDKRDNRIENMCIESPQSHSEHHNQKHAKVSTCVVCGGSFVPHATKRSRQQTCGRDCMRVLQSALAKEREQRKRESKAPPPLAAAVIRSVLEAT